MKNTTLLLVILAFVLALGVFLFSSSGAAVSPLNGNVAGNEEVQIAKLSVSGGNYVLSPSDFKVGQKVRLEADSSVKGCAKSIVISAFNVMETISSSDNIIEFTPNKPGTFNIACSMNMYQGTFSVRDETGKTSDYVEPVKASGGSCGAGGGGCGCGG